MSLQKPSMTLWQICILCICVGAVQLAATSCL